MHWYGVSGGDRQHFNASWNQEDQVMLYLGIDQHSKQLTVSIRDESGNAILRRQVSTQWKKVRDFFSEVHERGVAQGGYQAVVEICGFNHWLLKLLPECGCRETIVVQPEEKSKHKTDRRDASQLSEVLWVNRDRLAQGLPARGLRRIQVPDADGQADRRLTSLRHDVGRELTRAVNCSACRPKSRRAMSAVLPRSFCRPFPAPRPTRRWAWPAAWETWRASSIRGAWPTTGD